MWWQAIIVWPILLPFALLISSVQGHCKFIVFICCTSMHGFWANWQAHFDGGVKLKSSLSPLYCHCGNFCTRCGIFSVSAKTAADDHNLPMNLGCNVIYLLYMFIVQMILLVYILSDESEALQYVEKGLVRSYIR